MSLMDLWCSVPGEKLKILHALCGKLLTLVSTRDFIEDSADEQRQAKQELRELKAEQHRREREEAAIRVRKRKEEKLKEQEMKLKEKHEKLMEGRNGDMKTEEMNTSTESLKEEHQTEDEEEQTINRTRKSNSLQSSWHTASNHRKRSHSVTRSIVADNNRMHILQWKCFIFCSPVLYASSNIFTSG